MADHAKEAHWIEVRMQCNGELAEALAEVLGRFVSNGVAIQNITEYDPHTHNNTPTGGMIISGYLPANEHLEEKQRKLEEALWHLGQIAPVSKPVYTPIIDDDWMAAWKKHYKPIPIGDFLLVTPAWKEPLPNPGRVIIRIDPAMAFGTGAHPTSQLCLRLLERHITPDTPVIDVGCGSGILSITALKLGAERVLAVDISEVALASTQENAALNQITADVLETGKGSVEEILTGRFTLMHAPLVVVNILAPVIIRLFELGLGKLVEPGGKLLLSGILDHQGEDVLHAAGEAGFSLVEKITEGDWVAYAMMKISAE